MSEQVAGDLATLDVTVQDGIVDLLLDRPAAMNTIDMQMARDLLEVMHRLHRRDDVRAVLLRGAGPAFCGGGDLRSFASVTTDLGDHLEELLTHVHAAILRLLALDAPVVAAVHGSAAGAGFSLACAADLVVAARSSRFVLAYGAIGLTPDGAGSWFLPRLVGLGRALDLAMTNRVLDAAEAERWGIVSRVVDDEELEGQARALVRQLAEGPSLSLAATRRLLHDSWARPLEAQLAAEQHELGAAARRADGIEGIRAFLDKRPPEFRGA